MNKESISKDLYKDYVSRVNKVIDYIQKNIWWELNLGLIAKKACFSDFHFHRIFKTVVWETLNSYIKRIRLEKSAFLLQYNQSLPITTIALMCGFSNSQSFSKAFKKTYNISPSTYRNYSKNGYLKSKNGKEYICKTKYNIKESRPQIIFKSLTNDKMEIEVKEIPEMEVAYVRHIGPYKWNSQIFEELFWKLCSWAGPQGLLDGKNKMLSVYFDDPSFTDDSKLRLEVCIEIPENTKVKWEIWKQVLQGWKYWVSRFEFKLPEEYEKAWNEVYKEWLPKSWFGLDNRPAYEIYINDPKSHPEWISIVDIYIPLKMI